MASGPFVIVVVLECVAAGELIHTQRLEGSRFCNIAALSVASRRLPRITQGNLWPKVALFRCVDLNGADRAATRADVPGSRLLPTYITAKLQSGLPDEASQSLDDGAKSGSPPDAMYLGHSRATTFIEDERDCEVEWPGPPGSFSWNPSIHHDRCIYPLHCPPPGVRGFLRYAGQSSPF